MTPIKMKEILKKAQIRSGERAMIEATIEKCCINNEVAKETVAVMVNTLFMIGVSTGVNIINDMLKERGI